MRLPRTQGDTALTVVFHGAETPLELRHAPLPQLAEGEVLVRVTACTLCVNDLRTLRGERPIPMPVVLGHEACGVVAELGPGAPALDYAGAPLQCGQWVTWAQIVDCGRCHLCEAGLPQKCLRMRQYGHEPVRAGHVLSGGLAEYVHLFRGTHVVPLPPALPLVLAASASCSMATVAAALRTAELQAGESVLVHGLGMLGLLAIAAAREAGAGPIVACDPSPARRALALRCGAFSAEQPGELQSAVTHATGGRGIDVALDFSGAMPAVQQQLELLRVGGRSVLVGAVGQTPALSMRPDRIVRRCLSLRGVHHYRPRDLADAIGFLERASAGLPEELRHAPEFALPDVRAAIAEAARGDVLRVLVRPGEAGAQGRLA